MLHELNMQAQKYELIIQEQGRELDKEAIDMLLKLKLKILLVSFDIASVNVL